jgi:peptide/nickel transport system permease protein
MGSYIVRRLLLGMVVLVIVTIITFSLIQMVPGDPAVAILGLDATQTQIDALRKELGLDRPLIEQYIHWLSGVVHGEFGRSIMYSENVSTLIFTRLPITFHLSFFALILSTIIGVWSGVISAIRRGKILDSLITFFANIGVAIPIFWLGILGIYLFGLKLNWIAIYGYTSPFENFYMSIKTTILPIICLAIPAVALLARQTRSSMLEVIRQDYIRTAWAKGLKERTIVLKHSLKNSLIPVITILGLQLGHLIAGSVLVETVFNIPGMGRLIVQAAMYKDFTVVQACTFLIALIVVLASLIVDITYGWLDPTIRYR